MCVCECVSVCVCVCVCVCEWVGWWVVLSFARVRARSRPPELICSVYGHMHTVSTCVMLRAEVQRVHLKKKKKKKLTDKLVWEAGEQQLVASSGGSFFLSVFLVCLSSPNLYSNDFHKGALAALQPVNVVEGFYLKAGKKNVRNNNATMNNAFHWFIYIIVSSL